MDLQLPLMLVASCEGNQKFFVGVSSLWNQNQRIWSTRPNSSHSWYSSLPTPVHWLHDLFWIKHWWILFPSKKFGIYQMMYLIVQCLSLQWTSLGSVPFPSYVFYFRITLQSMQCCKRRKFWLVTSDDIWCGMWLAVACATYLLMNLTWLVVSLWCFNLGGPPSVGGSPKLAL